MSISPTNSAELLQAAREKDSASLAALMNAGVDVNLRGPGETTALMAASAAGRI